MQDWSSGCGAGGGRFSGGGGDRRFRPQGQQGLKCPRCESVNTKFCYYNNYNLSQPRYFCKTCRRYWTKGGVLRNVPVGGGCRKTKRSNPKSSNSGHPPSEKRKTSRSQNSSSDSSSLTANTTAVAPAEVLSATTPTNSALLNFDDSSRRFFGFSQSYDPLSLNHSLTENNLFSEIGTFTSLMTSSPTDPPPLELHIAGDVSSFPTHEHNTIQLVAENRSSTDQQWMRTDDAIGNPAGFLDKTGEIELSGLQYRVSNGALETEDQSLFDLTGAVDQSYWTQTQWHDYDHDYFP